MDAQGANGMACPYFEDEDPSQIVIKPLLKYICRVLKVV